MKAKDPGNLAVEGKKKEERIFNGNIAGSSMLFVSSTCAMNY